MIAGEYDVSDYPRDCELVIERRVDGRDLGEKDGIVVHVAIPPRQDPVACVEAVLSAHSLRGGVSGIYWIRNITFTEPEPIPADASRKASP